MTWHALPTYVNGALTAAMLNDIADNIEETAPGKATTAGRIFVATGTNAIAEREIASNVVSGADTTTSTSYVDLSPSGPAVTVTTGVLALVHTASQANNTTAGASSRHSFAVSGATTSAAADARGCLSQNSASRDTRYGVWNLMTLTGGSNTFTGKYKVSSGTGHWQDREQIVIAL